MSPKMRVKNIAWGLALYVTAIAAMYKFPVYEGTGAGTAFTESGRHRGVYVDTSRLGSQFGSVAQGGGARALAVSGDLSKGGSRM